jgi:hypothetical protein
MSKLEYHIMHPIIPFKRFKYIVVYAALDKVGAVIEHTYIEHLKTKADYKA